MLEATTIRWCLMFRLQSVQFLCGGGRRREEEMKHDDTKTYCVSCYSDSRAFLFWVSTHYLMNGDEVTSVYPSERFDDLTETRCQNFNSSFAFEPRGLFPVWTPSCTFISFFCLISADRLQCQSPVVACWLEKHKWNKQRRLCWAVKEKQRFIL